MDLLHQLPYRSEMWIWHWSVTCETDGFPEKKVLASLGLRATATANRVAMLCGRVGHGGIGGDRVVGVGVAWVQADPELVHHVVVLVRQVVAVDHVSAAV